MHPADMEDLGIVVGQEVEIRSATGVARAIVKDEEGLRRGVVSLSHGFGTRGDGRDPHLYGTSTNRLLSNSAEFDPTTGMPRMGAVPITIHPIPDFAEGLSDEGTRSTPK
jgi:anaerobic selenocysteine-containing dehydrogenase